MSKLLDKICKIRDLFTSKDYNKFKFHKMELLQLKEDIHRQIKKKSEDYNHQLDFTSQDLRELADDLRDVLNDWSNTMSPIKNIQDIAINDGVVNINLFMDKVIPIMIARTENMQSMTELLNLIEYHSVFLYYIELASNDEFALKYNVRF